jgi:PTH1 family peptidyl-tRNA hydrolase
MLLIVGLGNPGKQYEKTYHNLGFMALDFFSKKHQVELKKIKENTIIFEGQINQKKIILAKPQTYMNLSGTSVAKLAKRFQVEPKNILIIYDDVDLDEGAIRVREKGSAGTHNGMKNIVAQLGTTEFPRIRIGVGKDHITNRSLADYVLSNIKNVAHYHETFETVSELIEQFINKDGMVENKSIG